MNTTYNPILTLRVTLLGLIFGLPLLGSAAVITDPTLTSGTDAIDPAGSQSVNQSAVNSTSQATLEAISGFAGIHDYTGFVNRSTSPDNIVSFTSASLPDIRFSSSGGFNDGNNNYNTANATFETSPGSTIIFRTANSSNGTTPLNIFIEFGDYSSSTFTPNLNAVEAAGFVLTNMSTTQGITATFLDASGSTLSSQTATAGANGNEIYFGHQAVGATSGANDGIARINIQVTSPGTTGAYLGLDDLAFSPAVIPEPSTLAMMGLFGIGLMMKRFYKKR
jgi:hypothetical protein